MYCETNYKTKKDLIADFKAGKKIYIFSPGMGLESTSGHVGLCGPHFPAPHKWYANAEAVDGIITTCPK